MGYPLSQDYNEAIQNPRYCFADAELREGEAVTNALGLPQPRSGNFADVYEVHCPGTQTRWAVKCFTREVPGLRERYSEISAHLRQARLPFTVDFQYLADGINVRGNWYPILKMQWVEGFLLNEFVRNALERPATLDALVRAWVRMSRRLREADVAHCDLQHGNVLLVPEGAGGALTLKLIDYDGMWVPGLASWGSGEVGHPGYQHPQRLKEGTYRPEVDRFPLLLVATALRCLRANGPKALWGRYDNGDNLLFREADLRAPANSALFRELWQLDDPVAHALVGYLALAARGLLEQSPVVDQLLEEGTTPALTYSHEQELAGSLGFRARPIAAAPRAAPDRVASLPTMAAQPAVPVHLAYPDRWIWLRLLPAALLVLVLIGMGMRDAFLADSARGGLGDSEPRGDGKLLMTVDGSFQAGGGLTVMALVSNAAPGETLTLDAPDGFQIDGNASQRVPERAADASNRIKTVTWKVKAGPVGTYTLGVKSNAGGAAEQRLNIRATGLRD